MTVDILLKTVAAKMLKTSYYEDNINQTLRRSCDIAGNPCTVCGKPATGVHYLVSVAQNGMSIFYSKSNSTSIYSISDVCSHFPATVVAHSFVEPSHSIENTSANKAAETKWTAVSKTSD